MLCTLFSRSAVLFQQPRTFSSLLYRWWEINCNLFLTFLIHGYRRGELAVMLLGSVLPVGLGLPHCKIVMTWIWPIFWLLGLSHRVQETYDQILLTSTLSGAPKCSKKCLSLWLKGLKLNPFTREECESVRFTCPAVSMKVAWRSGKSLDQSCFSAICTVSIRCRWCPLLALCCSPL